MALSKGHTFTSGEVVTPTKLNNLVDNATIGDGTITTAMIADDAVTADKIATGAVTSDALASDAVGASSIDDLTDVDTSTAAPADGEGLIWSGTGSKWIPGSVSSGSGGSGIYQSSLSTDSGYTYFTNGMVIQWGKLSNVALNQSFHSVTWPVAFGVACDNVSATIHRASGAISGAVAPLVKSVTTTGCEIAGDHDTNTSTGDIYWTAIGRSAEQSSGGSSSGGGTAAYDSGWVTTDGSTTVANGATLTFNHGLSTSALNAQIWVSGSSDGSYPYLMDIQETFTDTSMVGAAITNITSTQITIQFANSGYVYMNSSGQNATSTVNGHDAASSGYVPFAGKYVRVVALASGSSSSSGTAAYSSGWFNNTSGLANGGTYSFTHGLGTEDFVTAIWVADDSSGTNKQVIFSDTGDSSAGSKVDGAVVSDASSTTLEVQLGANGGFSVSSTGNWSSFNWSTKYFKVVAVASGSSSGPRAFVAFDGTSSNLTGSITNSLNVTSITDQGTGLYDIAWTNTVANPVFTVAAENHNNELGLAGLKNITSSGVRLVGHSISSGASDPPYISIVAH